MNIVFGIIFCLSLAGGWGYGYLHDQTITGYVISIAISGFIGSSVVALLFSWLYFFQKETDREKIERLQKEINDLRQVKRIEKK